MFQVGDRVRIINLYQNLNWPRFGVVIDYALPVNGWLCFMVAQEDCKVDEYCESRLSRVN